MKRYDKNIRVGIGERLKTARKKAGFSQDQAAILTNIAKCRISQYENEHRSIDIYTLATFAECYQVSLDYLWYGNKFEYSNTRRLDYVLDILESLETLCHYGIIQENEKHLLFNSHKDSLLHCFIREYLKIFNEGGKYSKTELANIRALEENYQKPLYESIKGKQPKKYDLSQEEFLEYLSEKDGHCIFELLFKEVR